jgi:hypothetical protein
MVLRAASTNMETLLITFSSPKPRVVQPSTTNRDFMTLSEVDSSLLTNMLRIPIKVMASYFNGKRDVSTPHKVHILDENDRNINAHAITGNNSKRIITMQTMR